MSHNAECESDDTAVREKATVDALEKQVLGDLGADAVSGWWAVCEEILLPKGKVGSPEFSLGLGRMPCLCVCVCGCTGVHGAMGGGGVLCVFDVGRGQSFVIWKLCSKKLTAVSRGIPKKCGISPCQRRWGFLQESPMEQNLIISAGWKVRGW